MSIGFPRLPCTTDIPHSFAGTSQYRRVQLIVTHFIYWRGKNVAFPFLPASPASYNFSLPLSLSLSLSFSLFSSSFPRFVVFLSFLFLYLTESFLLVSFDSFVILSFFPSRSYFLGFEHSRAPTPGFFFPTLNFLLFSALSLGFFPVCARPRASKSFSLSGTIAPGSNKRTPL